MEVVGTKSDLLVSLNSALPFRPRTPEPTQLPHHMQKTSCPFTKACLLGQFSQMITDTVPYFAGYLDMRVKIRTKPLIIRKFVFSKAGTM